jgi:hypothetical protein
MNISNGVQGAGKIDVPQFQTLMLPLLKVMGGGHEMSTIQMRDAVAINLFMTAEALSLHLPTGPSGPLILLQVAPLPLMAIRKGWEKAFFYSHLVVCQ